MKLTKEEAKTFYVTLETMGYRRFSGSPFKKDDFSYCKSFDVTKDKHEENVIGYQIGLYVFDHSKFPQYTEKECIGIQFEFMLGNDKWVDRLDLSISDDNITVEKFEAFCDKFYKTMCNSKEGLLI
jgi:hypothetical protein